MIYVLDEVQHWTAQRKVAAGLTLRMPAVMGGAGAVTGCQQSRPGSMQAGWTK